MTNNTTVLSSSSYSGLRFSSQLVWEDQLTDTSESPINGTHIIGTFTRNGTLNLSGSGEKTISISSYEP